MDSNQHRYAKLNRVPIVVDFDNTIHNMGDFKKGDPIGEPIEGAKEALWDLYNSGYDIIVHTCRTAAKSTSHFDTFLEKTPSEKKDSVFGLYEWFGVYCFPPVTIWFADKPWSPVYIDDKAIKFEGNWDDIVDQVKKITPNDPLR